MQRVAAYTLLREGNRFLMCRLSSEIRPNGAWTLPGGGVEWGELPPEAAVRETFEETGLEIEIGDLLTLNVEHYTYPDVRMQAFRFIYAARVVGGTLTFEQNGSTDRCEWFTPGMAFEVPLTTLARVALNLLGAPLPGRGRR